MMKCPAKFSRMHYLIFLCMLYPILIQGQNEKTDEFLSNEIEHTVFTIGGIGNTTLEEDNRLLYFLKSELGKAPENSSLLFLGDNVSEKEGDWNTDLKYLDKHLNTIEGFAGETYFLPGNNEWASYNAKKVERLQDHVKDLDMKRVSFLPKNACPLEYQEVSDQLAIIFIDSKWFLENWSRLKNVNIQCTDIVTRRRFVEALEGYINDSQGKNLLIAMHHPVFSNGKYAGQPSLKTHLLPLPFLGTAIHEFVSLGAFDPDYLNAYKYRFLRIIVSALIKNARYATIVSAHEDNLQLLHGEGIHQIITGTVSKTSRVRLTKDLISAPGGTLRYEGIFGKESPGYSKVTYYKDGSHDVEFSYLDNGVIKKYKKNLSDAFEQPKAFDFKDFESFEKSVSIYDESAVKRTGSHKFLWGERYRKYYGDKVKVPVVILDTLYGGLEVVKKGGGHQSNTLRLKDSTGGEYNMRSLKKNALRFLRFQLPGFTYDEEEFEETWVQDVVNDFFTTAHPYTQMAVNPIAKAANINHSDTELFYVPKQEALGRFNETYGNELYFIERRPSDEQYDYVGYRRMFKTSGSVEDFESTTDMLEKLKSDESYTVDAKAFIKARIFDMWIGDWDRHQDQWRWMEYEKEDEKLFVPVPRDRDNAFPRFDGAALQFLKLFVPIIRPWQTFGPEIQNVKWLNRFGMPLDKALTSAYGADTWRELAEEIVVEMDEEKIDSAFERLPEEVKDDLTEQIKENLKERLKKLPEYAYEHGQYLNRIVSVQGTHKDDSFEVYRNQDGTTTVIAKRLLKDEKDPIFYKRTFNPEETKEIHIYGLNDDDEFEIKGDAPSKIKVRLIGGYGEDSYDISNTKKLKIYEWKHEESDLKNEKGNIFRTDRYKTNTYHWRYHKPNTNILLPAIGFRTDDGVFVGATNTFTKNGINGNPFRQRHTLGAKYYFDFQAMQLDYNGTFGNIFPNWNFELDAFYTSDLYARNFFGLGNNTTNAENQLDIDFYRARLRQIRIASGVSYRSLKLKILYESFQVNENEDRLFNSANFDESIFENQNYIGTDLTVRYDISNSGDFPTRALRLHLDAGYRLNTEFRENRFGYLAISMGFDRKLISSGNLVLSSDAAWRSNFKGDYFFYHAPSIGGNNGLRGFRDERFTGDSYFYHTSDLKLRLKRFTTTVAPVSFGIYGGFDYGRVWQPGEDSGRWHTSQGVGVWLGTLSAVSLQAGWFNSAENNLIQVGFGLSF